MPKRSLLDDSLTRVLEEDQHILAKTHIPIVTVSASFRDIVEIQHTIEDELNLPDVVFSRAHYSMALAVAVAAWGKNTVDREKAWLVDPTNYVTKNDWNRIAFSETVGRVLARSKTLEWVKKNIIDRYGRKKLPIISAIAPPLLFLCEKVKRPIISLHDQAGNILAGTGKTIVQVVTDPYIRPEYVYNAHLPHMHYCVFDEKTKFDFLEMAASMDKKVDPDRVVVTGPPVDPRIVAAREKKLPDSWRRRPLRVLLTTGGLGTNKSELRSVLNDLLPLTRSRNRPVHIVYYAGTNADHEKMVQQMAREAKVRVGDVGDPQASLRILFADEVVTANQLLLVYGFPWADLVVTKPSGDMAYDAVAAGCAQLFLRPWGDWEKSILHVFTQLGTAREAEIDRFGEQLRVLMESDDEPWLTSALRKAQSVPPVFLRGAHNIVAVAQRVR